MASFEARKVLMKDAQGRYVIPVTGAVETVNGQKPDENGNVVIEGVDTTTLLTKTAAAKTYLSKADASTTYLTVDTAAGTFLSKTDAASTYLKAGAATDTFLSKADASSTYLTPAQANVAYLGVGDKAVSAETADNAVSATMASKAISDINGNAIATTYATNQKLFANDGVGPLLRSDVMPIKTVNGQEPDANGNIQVGTGDAYEADILEAADKALETVTNVGNTDIADVLSAVASLEAKAATWNPVATVVAFAANSAPSGYLLCNGAAVSRTTYAELFAAIGTLYGEGDGSTTFNLPHLINNFIEGSDTAGTWNPAGLPEIYGYINVQNDRFQGVGGAFTEGTYATRYTRGASSDGSGAQGVVFQASKHDSIYGNSSTVQPPALTMRYYIKY